MPEGDTIHHAANRIRPILLGHVPDEIATPHPRFGADRWPERLAGRAVESVDAHGKHLFLRFAGDLVLHSHLRMTGSWGTYAEGRRWRRSPRRAWLVLRRDDRVVVQFDGPVLELLTQSRARFDQRIAALGPDVVAAAAFDERRYLRRLREDDPTRSIGDALLDQRTVAGMGTVWRTEACWHARVDPHRRAGAVSDRQALELIHARPAADAALGAARSPGRRATLLQPCRQAVSPLRDADPRRDAGRRQPPRVLVPGCQE